MARKIIVTLIVVLFSCCLYATPQYLISFDFGYGHDTNVFSDPLPMYEKPDKTTGNLTWLPWRAEHPFLTKHSIGGDISADIFIHDYDRVGFSAGLRFLYPLKSTTITPIPDEGHDFRGEWHYHESDSTSDQKTSLFFGLGPVFMARLDKFDVGLTLRASIGVYDYVEGECIVGIQAEPFIHFHFNDHIFLNFKMTYDGHLIRFIEDANCIYDEHYSMLTVYPAVGLGFRF